MLRIKKILNAVKNDIREHPTAYVCAIIGGIAGGTIAYVISTSEDNGKSLCHLEMTKDVAEYMKNTGTKTLFDTPLGTYQLEYVNY
jgi:hypothetical protein